MEFGYESKVQLGQVLYCIVLQTNVLLSRANFVKICFLQINMWHFVQFKLAEEVGEKEGSY